MKYLIFIPLILFISCSFSSSDGEGVVAAPTSNTQLIPTEDADGDGFSNKTEVEQGSNPLVADIPKLDISLSQKIDFTIEMNDGENERNIKFSHKNEPGSPYYSPYVGAPLIKRKIQKHAAGIARLPNHQIGEIEDRDLSFFTYPNFNEEWKFSKALELEKYKEFEFHNIFVDFNLSIKLRDNQIFDSISNLVLNFYVYDSTGDKYSLIDIQEVDRSFLKGNLEVFPVSLRVQKEFLYNEILKKGRFIYVEVQNYNVDKHSKSLKRLRSAIKEKTIPLIVSHKNSLETFHVAREKSLKFIEVMNAVYPNNFELKDNKLIKVQEFESTLAIPSNLSELRNETNLGQWFIQTNINKENIFKKELKKGDHFILAFLTGEELSRISERDYDTQGINKNSTGSLVDLGKISASSRLSMTIDLAHHYGQRNSREVDIVEGQRSCGKNCNGRDVRCYFEINTIVDLSVKEGIFIPLHSMYLHHKNTKVSIGSIREKIDLRINRNGIHLTVDNLNQLFKDLRQDSDGIYNDDDSLYLSIEGQSESVYEGILLTKMEGAHFKVCPEIATAYATKLNLPLNESSTRFNEWSQLVNWGNIKRGTEKKVRADFRFNLISKIVNYYN